jgi:hypothetical protein
MIKKVGNCHLINLSQKVIKYYKKWKDKICTTFKIFIYGRYRLL